MFMVLWYFEYWPWGFFWKIAQFANGQTFLASLGTKFGKTSYFPEKLKCHKILCSIKSTKEKGSQTRTLERHFAQFVMQLNMTTTNSYPEICIISETYHKQNEWLFCILCGEIERMDNKDNLSQIHIFFLLHTKFCGNAIKQWEIVFNLSNICFLSNT